MAEACWIIDKCLLIDDLITSPDSVEQAVALRKNVSCIWAHMYENDKMVFQPYSHRGIYNLIYTEGCSEPPRNFNRLG